MPAASCVCVVPVMSWEAYVHLAFDEIRQAGAASPQVARRMRASLEDLRDYAEEDRVRALDEQLALLDEAVRRVVPEAELAYALEPDRQGIGVSAGGRLETSSLSSETLGRR